MATLKPYYKAFTYAFGAIAAVILSYHTDGVFTGAEIAQTALLAFGTFLVYLAENAPGAKFVKFVMAAVIAGLQVLVAAMEVGSELSSDVWLNVAIAVGMALGVLAVENKPEAAVPATATTPSSGTLPRAA